VILSRTFTIVAFIGLRVYDGQISKVKYTLAALAAKHKKNLRRENIIFCMATKNRKSFQSTKRLSKIVPLEKFLEINKWAILIFKRLSTVFHNNRASEIMCDGNSYKMKIDGKIVDGKGPLTADSTIFICETDGDHIVFADASGNRYTKSIDSLFDQ
jgi:hypothetical protein